MKGALIVVGGHSRGVGKTALIEHVLRATRDERWAVIKISAHRHAPMGDCVPVIEEELNPAAATQTGRYLAAGATRAFLMRAPDAALDCAAAFIESLRRSGWHVIVESNRIVRSLTPDVLIFVVNPSIADWKPTSSVCVAAPHAIVSGPPWDPAALDLIGEAVNCALLA